jgi:hypothetical protein
MKGRLSEKVNAARDEGKKLRARMAKVTVTIPAETLKAATANVQSGKAPSLSAYVSRALATQVAADEKHDAFIDFLDCLDAELGPPSEADHAWALQFARQ